MGEQQLKNIARVVHVYRIPIAGSAAVAKAPLPLPDKPSIAVLPFANMSGDPEQEYFADGMVEEATTAIFLPPKSVVFQSLKDGGGFGSGRICPLDCPRKIVPSKRRRYPVSGSFLS
jgi:hypothetical protein